MRAVALALLVAGLVPATAIGQATEFIIKVITRQMKFDFTVVQTV